MKIKLSQIKKAIQLVRGQLLSNSSITHNALIHSKKNSGVKISIRRFEFEEVEGKIKAYYTTQSNKIIKVGI